jgi:hypothetical protein
MKLIDNIDFQYVPATKTDVMATLKRLGFEPPSEDKRFIEKWQTYKHLAWRNEK